MKKLLPLLALGVTVAAAEAQDQFGAEVFVGDNQVFVMKPNAGRGLSQVNVFSNTGSAWEMTDRLLPAAVQ